MNARTDFPNRPSLWCQPDNYSRQLLLPLSPWTRSITLSPGSEASMSSVSTFIISGCVSTSVFAPVFGLVQVNPSLNSVYKIKTLAEAPSGPLVFTYGRLDVGVQPCQGVWGSTTGHFIRHLPGWMVLLCWSVSGELYFWGQCYINL